MHLLAAEAGRRVEDRPLAPAAARQARLFLELATGAVEWRLSVLERPRRQLEQLLPHRLPPLADERKHSLPVDRHDHNGTRMLDDLSLVLPPALEGDIHELSVVDDP